MISTLDATGQGDSIDIAMFYLSDRGVIRALLDADRRGAKTRIILDPNKDSFGREKGGIPNRQVAYELTRKSSGRILVRWFDTHGEQFHAKLVVVRHAGRLTMFGGSANLTRRNLRDYNLEADLMVIAPRDATVSRRVMGYVERIWTNRGGQYTVEYETYEDRSILKRLVYRVQEFAGLSSY